MYGLDATAVMICIVAGGRHRSMCRMLRAWCSVTAWQHAQRFPLAVLAREDAPLNEHFAAKARRRLHAQ
jgi:hypothetical protein